MVSRVFLVLVVLQVLYISVQTRNRQQCSQVCTLKFKPVCDSTGKVYRSQCVLDVAICNDPSIRPGVCGVTQPECPRFCPEVYQPVCDSTGTVYSNQCFLNIAICNDPSIKPGACGSSF
ncbi:hypothetical protein OTU49_010505 [Cherax quadricarinatus]|uniref:Kazal-like domain-containing protein n=2 Tax=Cherax quadricarinatus TaxID=27406 RepID=A0AAW0WDR5_CHEQU